MSKYSEIVDSVDAFYKQWFEFRDRCWNNLTLLVNGFIAYCEIPPEKVRIVPTNEESKEKTRYNVIGAVHYGDGSWQLGLIISFGQLLQLRLRIYLTEHNGKVIVRAGDDGKFREIDPANAADREAFYNEIVEDIKRLLTQEPKFDDASSIKRIGFDVEMAQKTETPQTQTATA